MTTVMYVISTGAVHFFEEGQLNFSGMNPIYAYFWTTEVISENINNISQIPEISRTYP